MQRKSTLRLLLEGFGYMVFGNILGTVMTISISVVIDNPFIQAIATLFTVFIYLSLMFTVGYKDGLREEKLLRLNRVESVDKSRWLKLGTILWLIMCLTPILMMILVGIGQYDFIMWGRWICGALYPLALLIGGTDVSLFPIWLPIIYIAFYALTPLACKIGFNYGFKGGIDTDKIMYQK